MSAEEHFGLRPLFRGYFTKCLQQAISLGIDKARVIEPHSNFLDQWRRFADFVHGSSEVFSVLATSAVTAEHRGEKRNSACSSIVGHFAKGVRQHRFPNAVTPINGELESALVAFLLNRSDQISALAIDGADTPEMLVVLGDFQHPLPRDIFSAKHIFEERHNVFGAFGAPEGNEKDRIDRHIREWWQGA
jgi:hypothetical protein